MVMHLKDHQQLIVIVVSVFNYLNILQFQCGYYCYYYLIDFFFCLVSFYCDSDNKQFVHCRGFIIRFLYLSCVLQNCLDL